MMKLPSEVFNLIFLLLVQRDRLECMTVCREWHDHISRHHSLFREILILHQRQLTDLIKTVEMKPVVGTKVEKLSLQLEFNSNDYVTTFVELFPNLRHFNFSYTCFTYRHINSITPHQSHSWCKHIQTMLENFSHIHTQILLNSGQCPNLTFISVSGFFMQPLSGFVEALPNAPALKTLQLNRYLLSFDDIELLHQNAPHLVTLIMEFMEFNLTPQPRDINPASSVRSFRWIGFDFDSFDAINPHLPYIFQKYTHLEDLALEIGTPRNVSDEGYEDSVAQHNIMLRSYLIKLAPGLKTLSLTVNGKVQDYHIAFDFNFLDECGCQVRTLNLGSVLHVHEIERLSTTTQVRHLQSLRINIKLGKDDQSRLMECIRQFTMLKELKLSVCISRQQREKHELDLADLLDALREIRLETLVLGNLDLKLNKERTTRTYPWLKYLSCFCVTFGVGTDAFISKSFPNLKSLELNKCFGKGETITLPQTNLTYLKLLNARGYYPLQGLVITLDNNQKRLYTTNRKPISISNELDMGERDISTLAPVLSESYNGSSNVPFVTIICKSVYHVSFLNAYV